jgi:hypothetical protein
MTFSMLMYGLMACTCAGLMAAFVVETVRPAVKALRHARLNAPASPLGRLRVQQSQHCAGPGDARSAAIHPHKPTERRRRDCSRRDGAQRLS